MAFSSPLGLQSLGVKKKVNNIRPRLEICPEKSKIFELACKSARVLIGSEVRKKDVRGDQPRLIMFVLEHIYKYVTNFVIILSANIVDEFFFFSAVMISMLPSPSNC